MSLEEKGEQFDNIEKLVIATCLLREKGASGEYIQKVVDVLQEYKELKKEAEKLKPKKPELYRWGFYDEMVDYRCPTCKDSWNVNEYGAGIKYCWECGQAIDWSEVE